MGRALGRLEPRLLLGLLVALEVRGAEALTLNEILYDPPGTDAGREYVELYHAGPAPVSLDGLSLVFVNGASPEPAREIWRAPDGLSLPPGSFFVVGGEEVQPRQGELGGSLQNGPDALRLERDGVVLDAVAWGEMEGLGEGPPAEDPSGRSLGRVPDGADTDDNAADWRALDEATPGAPNAAAVALAPGALRAEPAWRALPGSVWLRATVRARGWAERQSAPLAWGLDGAPVGEDVVEMAAGESLQVEIEVWVGYGLHHMDLQVLGDAPSRVALGYRVGAGPVVLNEVLPRPLPDEPEWIELRGVRGAPWRLEGWSLADGTGRFHDLPDLDLGGEGGLALLTADAPELRRVHSPPPAVEVAELEGGWPSLNNQGDEVLLRDAEGVVVDRVAWGEELPAPEGRSLQRVLTEDGSPVAWLPSPEGSTPGRENPSAGAPLPTEGLEVDPNPFSPDGDGEDDLLRVALRHRLPGRVRAEVVDLVGERVRLLGEDGEGGEVRLWLWDGTDERGRPVPLGAYLVRVRSDGPPPRSWSTLVALGRRR